MTDEPETLSDRLWNDVTEDLAAGPREGQYHLLVMEQYKLYLEMTDRNSARRGGANTYFLSLNTALAAALAVVFRDLQVGISPWILTGGVILLVTECATWLAIMRSYRLLNVAKFKVIAAFEERLPARAYTRAEWSALGEGRDWRLYLPLTHIEMWVPIMFAAMYLLGFAAIMF